MSIFGRFKLAFVGARIAQEELYASVLREIESGARRDGLWAKSLADANGDEKKAKGLYIDYRVQSLRDENAIAQRLLEIENVTAAQNRVADERQRVVDECSRTLSRVGYSLTPKSDGWEVWEPSGGKVGFFRSAEELAAHVAILVRASR